MRIKKILIADDHPIFRKGIALLLKNDFPDLEIIEAANGLEIIKKYQAHQPDLLLVDYSMPQLNGFQAAEQLLVKNKAIKIILFTMYDTLEVALNFLKIGGRGFIVKGGETDEVIAAIRTVSNGDYYFNSQFEKEISHWLLTKNGNISTIKFAARELEIILKLSRGMTCAEIANYLHLSTRTIESYRADLIKKTGVKNSAELIAYVYRQGILI